MKSSILPIVKFSHARITPVPIKLERLKTHIDNHVLDFIYSYINVESESIKIFETSSKLNIDLLDERSVNFLVNFKKVNDIRFLNKFFESINRKLISKGMFIGCVETYEQRAKRIFRKYPVPLVYPYYILDFILKRIFPKFKLTQGMYFLLTQGKNRVLSKAETMGRLISCGFSIVNLQEINNYLYFVARKDRDPYYDLHPTYGPLVKMKRVGQHGKMVYVYKFRTMHPFAEYLQSYIYQTSALKEGGKYDNDFRITGWGKFLRKFWIDEFPMILNLLKGEVKLVGVRPLSPHYLSLYKNELSEKRLKFKPGLVPPYYADLPKTLEDIMESEEKYLEEYEKNPFITDWNYFWKAFNNIVIKKARSS